MADNQYYYYYWQCKFLISVALVPSTFIMYNILLSEDTIIAYLPF